MDNPSLTIGVPCFNSERFIADAIKSILNQSFQDFEVLILDNASTDRTISIASTFQDPRIKILRNEKNEGPHYSIERLHREAKGTFFRCLCSDDVLLPNAISKQMEFARQIPNIGIVTCDHIVTDELLKPSYTVRCIPGVSSGEAIISNAFYRKGNFIGGPSNYLYPSLIAKKTKLHRDIKYLGDLEYAFQILKHGCYANTGELGLLYRRHDNTDTNKVFSEERETADWIRLLELHGTPDPDFLSWLRSRRATPEDQAKIRGLVRNNPDSRSVYHRMRSKLRARAVAAIANLGRI